nr:hypothetical protein [Sphaerochaetaceae bacterium]
NSRWFPFVVGILAAVFGFILLFNPASQMESVAVYIGLIATGMGNLEKEKGEFMLKFGAEKRMGLPDELGYAIATVADERNGYLAGVDILCDGGCTYGKKFRK